MNSIGHAAGSLARPAPTGAFRRPQQRIQDGPKGKSGSRSPK